MVDGVVQEGGPVLLRYVSTGHHWPPLAVHVPWCRQIFELVHFLSHPGVRASVKLVGSKFVWPDLRKDVKEWLVKNGHHTKAPLEPFSIPARGYDHVHIDLVGFLYDGGSDHQVAGDCFRGRGPRVPFFMGGSFHLPV